MKIGIATCADMPDLTAGDQELVARLAALGMHAKPFIWNQPLTPEFDAIVIRSTWDYHLRHQEFLAWIDEVDKTSIKLINPAPTIRWNLDKSYLTRVSQSGIAVVPLKIVSRQMSTSEIMDQIRQAAWGEIVIKPTISATSYLTFRTEGTNPDLPALIERIKNHSDILIQPYLPSILTQGELSLIFFNGERIAYSHSVLKRSKAREFRVQREFGGLEDMYAPSDRLIELARSSLQCIPHEWVFARVDLMDWAGQPKLSELELVEPDLFLLKHTNAAESFAKAIRAKLLASL